MSLLIFNIFLNPSSVDIENFFVLLQAILASLRFILRTSLPWCCLIIYLFYEFFKLYESSNYDFGSNGRCYRYCF